MSRIGKQPILIPDGVTARLDGRALSVSGPRGTLSRTIHPEISVRVEGGAILATPVGSSRKTSAYWGLTRAIIAGMVEGVSKGFEKKLEIEGVGYRAISDNGALQLSIGFSHPVRIEAPEGISFKVEKNIVTVAGFDKELVGNTAASIRRVRPPEPYKGKGIRYAGEVIKRKAGKKAVSSAG